MPAERRIATRTTAYHAENLRLTPSSRSALSHGIGYAGHGFVGHLGAGSELIDISDTGLGLKVFTPLVIGSDVSIDVELHSTVSCVALKVDARVVHCRSQDDELYRVGLSIQALERLPLQCGHAGVYAPDMDG